MQAKSIAECSKESILQYFRPSLSYQLSLRSLFCPFLSCRFAKVLLYIDIHLTILINYCGIKRDSIESGKIEVKIYHSNGNTS